MLRETLWLIPDVEQLSIANPQEIIWYSCFTNVLEEEKKNPQIFFFGKGSRESRASMSSTVKKCWDSEAKRGFVSRIQPGRHCLHQLSLSPTFSFQYLTGFLKVNSGSAQWDTCSFPTTGNKFARQACVSQIKSALFGMIYERNVMLLAFGCRGAEGLMVARGVPGGAVGWWVSDLSNRKTDL